MYETIFASLLVYKYTEREGERERERDRQNLYHILCWLSLGIAIYIESERDLLDCTAFTISYMILANIHYTCICTCVHVSEIFIYSVIQHFVHHT